MHPPLLRRVLLFSLSDILLATSPRPGSPCRPASPVFYSFLMAPSCLPTCRSWILCWTSSATPSTCGDACQLPPRSFLLYLGTEGSQA